MAYYVYYYTTKNHTHQQVNVIVTNKDPRHNTMIRRGKQREVAPTYKHTLQSKSNRINLDHVT